MSDSKSQPVQKPIDLPAPPSPDLATIPSPEVPASEDFRPSFGDELNIFFDLIIDDNIKEQT